MTKEKYSLNVFSNLFEGWITSLKHFPKILLYSFLFFIPYLSICTVNIFFQQNMTVPYMIKPLASILNIFWLLLLEQCLEGQSPDYIQSLKDAFSFKKIIKMLSLVLLIGIASAFVLPFAFRISEKFYRYLILFVYVTLLLSFVFFVSAVIAVRDKGVLSAYKYAITLLKGHFIKYTFGLFVCCLVCAILALFANPYVWLSADIFSKEIFVFVAEILTTVLVVFVGVSLHAYIMVTLLALEGIYEEVNENAVVEPNTSF